MRNNNIRCAQFASRWPAQTFGAMSPHCQGGRCVQMWGAAKEMLSRGASLEAKDGSGQTPLDHVVALSASDTVRAAEIAARGTVGASVASSSAPASPPPSIGWPAAAPPPPPGTLPVPELVALVRKSKLFGTTPAARQAAFAAFLDAHLAPVSAGDSRA